MGILRIIGVAGALIVLLTPAALAQARKVYISVVADLAINGRSVGEGGMNVALARWYGVPVVMVTGDDVAVEQVRESVPGVRGVVVKRAINERTVELVPLARARQDIERAAREVVAAVTKAAPERDDAYRVQMRFRGFAIPEVATAFEGIERPAPDTVAFTRKTMPEAYRLIRVLYRFIAAN